MTEQAQPISDINFPDMPNNVYVEPEARGEFLTTILSARSDLLLAHGTFRGKLHMTDVSCRRLFDEFDPQMEFEYEHFKECNVSGMQIVIVEGIDPNFFEIIR